MVNLIIITSVINFINKPLYYTKTRSIFSARQRLVQTIKTINSLINKIPNPYIILLEGSRFDLDQESKLKKSINLYQNYSGDIKIYEAINGPYKSYGESLKIIKFLTSPEFNNIKKYK